MLRVFRGCIGDCGLICVRGHDLFLLTLKYILSVVKVAPSVATSFFTYELVKEYLVPP